MRGLFLVPSIAMSYIESWTLTPRIGSVRTYPLRGLRWIVAYLGYLINPLNAQASCLQPVSLERFEADFGVSFRIITECTSLNRVIGCGVVRRSIILLGSHVACLNFKLWT